MLAREKIQALADVRSPRVPLALKRVMEEFDYE
jgi:hypothetical protein